MLSFVGAVQAQTDVEQLAKAMQNPLASLINVPIQGNFDFGTGPANGHKTTFNIQPVIPVSINEKWNLVTRTILPIISQSDMYGPSGSQFGLGDVLFTGFFSPKAPTANGVIWGVGPAILLPTSTDNLLGAGKFGAGPSALALKQVGAITYGALVNHVWAEGISNTFLNPFLAKNYAGGYAMAINTEITQNWEADAFSGVAMITGSKVFTIGKQACSAAVGPRIHYGHGRYADWGIRAQLAFMFPK